MSFLGGRDDSTVCAASAAAAVQSAMCEGSPSGPSTDSILDPGWRGSEFRVDPARGWTDSGLSCDRLAAGQSVNARAAVAAVNA